MARFGGFRPGAGRPRGTGRLAAEEAAMQKTTRKCGRKQTPLQYMLEVMNDPTADVLRRDRMAIAAASFCHPRMTDQKVGKKDQQAQAAETAGTGTEWGKDLEFEVRAN